MKEIETLETAVGKKVEQWNVSDLDKFSLDENLDLLQLLKQKNVISECVKRSKDNKELLDIFHPLLIKSELTDSEKKINELLKSFSEKKITSDELEYHCTELLNQNIVYDRLMAYLALITMFPEISLLDKEISIKEDVSEIKETICSLAEHDLYSCYTLIEDLLQVIIPLRQRYHLKNQIDILDDSDDRLKKSMDELISLKLALGQSADHLSESTNEGDAHE